MLILSPIDEVGQGEALRDAALQHLHDHRAELIATIQSAALNVASVRGTVTADDIRAVVPIPVVINPKVVGAAFSQLARKGLLVHVGFKKSRRPQAHARPLSVWQLADPAAARAWLANHPPLPTDPTI